MGEVYKARDTRLDRIVAIKVLPADVAADPDLKQRFEREARAVAALNHPHICILHDIGNQDGTDFLVMEYLDGETLADRLKMGPVPIDQALTIAIQVASALDAAHRAGITHRDLKPGNVMLVKAGAKLLDFGLAKTAVSRSVRLQADNSALPTVGPTLTKHGTILGTFQYMAPEQLEGQEADARTDLFAFGAVVYEMLTGKKAFEGKSQASLISAIMSAQPPAMTMLQPVTPATLERIVTTCLAKDPDDRWQTARDLLRELKWIADKPDLIRSGPHAEAGSGAQTPDLIGSGLRTGLGGRTQPEGAWRVVAAVALLAALALAWPATLYLRRAAPPAVATRLDVVAPQTAGLLQLALSPDGRQLAFVAPAGSVAQLWVRPFDQTAARPLIGTDGAEFPFWSPDGRSLGFFADGKLKRIDLTGGAPRVLADASAARGGTWSRDGVILFAPQSGAGLARVAAVGGLPSEVLRLVPDSIGYRWPQFLPDGRFLVFVAAADANVQGVYVGSLDGREPTRLMQSETAAAYAPPGYLLSVSQGVLIARRFDVTTGLLGEESISVASALASDPGTFRGAFSVSGTGVLAYRAGGPIRRKLAWVDRGGNALGDLLPADETSFANPQLDPDGRRAIVTRVAASNADLWLIDVARGNPGRFSFDTKIDTNAVWSPDGSRVVFVSSRNGKFDVFEKLASSATDERPLLVTSQDKSTLDWSFDGKTVLYAVQDSKNGSDLWALPLDGGAKPFPVVESVFDDVQGQFSPDGRLVAYASNETGRYEVYVKAFPEQGGRLAVSTAGGIAPRWRRDGRELFYVAPDGKMMAVVMRMGPEARAMNPSSPIALFSTQLASGGGILPGGFRSRAQYAVAPDGRFLLNVAADDNAATPITVVLDWDAALKK